MTTPATLHEVTRLLDALGAVESIVPGVLPESSIEIDGTGLSWLESDHVRHLAHAMPGTVPMVRWQSVFMRFDFGVYVSPIVPRVHWVVIWPETEQMLNLGTALPRAFGAFVLAMEQGSGLESEEDSRASILARNAYMTASPFDWARELGLHGGHDRALCGFGCRSPWGIPGASDWGENVPALAAVRAAQQWQKGAYQAALDALRPALAHAPVAPRDVWMDELGRAMFERRTADPGRTLNADWRFNLPAPSMHDPSWTVRGETFSSVDGFLNADDLAGAALSPKFGATEVARAWHLAGYLRDLRHGAGTCSDWIDARIEALETTCLAQSEMGGVWRRWLEGEP